MDEMFLFPPKIIISEFIKSAIKGKITVNFEEAGKVVIDGTRISLEIVFN